MVPGRLVDTLFYQGRSNNGVTVALKVLAKMGLRVNIEESALMQKLLWLGMEWEINDTSLSLASVITLKTLCNIRRAYFSSMFPRRLLRCLNFAAPTLPIGGLKDPHLKQEVNLAISISQCDQPRTVPATLHHLLRPWLHH